MSAIETEDCEKVSKIPRHTDSLLESQLECQICLSMICEPITIQCGHSFCRTCLVHSLRKTKKQCVVCRSICTTLPEEASENIMLKNLAMTLNPELYSQRQVEAAAEKASWNTVLPVFFYNEVLFPGQILHLHLFEPRYRLMMQRVAANSRKFAYVYVSPQRQPLGSIALIANVREAEFLADGRCMTECVMTHPRMKIVDLYEESGTQGLYLAHLTPVHDLGPGSPPATAAGASTGRVCPYSGNAGVNIASGNPFLAESTDISSTSGCPGSTGAATAAGASNDRVAEDAQMATSNVDQRVIIIRLIDDCLKLLNRANPSVSRQLFEPLPPTPSLDLSPSDFQAAVEGISLAIMGMCRGSCMGEKVPFLLSEDKSTIDRLIGSRDMLLRQLAHLEGSGMHKLGGIISQSVGGILSWMNSGAGRRGADESSDEDEKEGEDESDDHS